VQFAHAVTYPRPYRLPPSGPPEFTGLTVAMHKWSRSIGLWVERTANDGKRSDLAPSLLRYTAREPDLASSEEEIRRQAVGLVTEVLAAAGELDFPQVSVCPGAEMEDEEDHQSRLMALLRSLNELWKRASQQGRDLLIDAPLPGHPGQDPEELEEILRLVDGDVGLCYDLTAQIPPENLRPAIRNLRVAVVTEDELPSMLDDVQHHAGSWYDGPITVESMFARG